MGDKRRIGNYYLGLDMGTSSVGWAVTDSEYRLLRAKRKDLWGIREFDEADTAVDRRTHRISRRRRQREVVRIGLLKEYFHDAICQKDSLFFQRLENSKYHMCDKDEAVRTKNGLFHDENYCDSDYFKEYPTIFHLRKELIENPSQHDVRLVYLALLNMFKHRGHFLNSSLSESDSQRKMGEVYIAFCNALSEIADEYETEIAFILDVSAEEIEEILSNKDFSRTRKAEELAALLAVNKKEKSKTAFIKAICGLKVKAELLFPGLPMEEDNKVEICFSEFGYEEKVPEIMDALGEKYYDIVELMKEMYDIGVLANIMKGHTYLSEARVAEYEKHAKDLKILKNVVKQYKSKEEYDQLFRSDNKGTYSAYVNSYNSGKKTRRNMEGRTREDLYKNLKKLLSGIQSEDNDVDYILSEIDKETFLPKQLTASNGVIPNQVHAKEMKKILNNAEQYLEFLKVRDESGLSVSERILRLFSFQIPYYVGPTNEKSKTGWVVRKEQGQILPWNIEQKIDMKQTSEAFISRMVRRCSYINDEKVLPKGSLLYESFCVLNEINNIRINGERIPVSLKQDIYNELFKRGKTVTKKKLVGFLLAQGAIEDETQVSGIDVTIHNSLSTYGKFKAVFGEKIDEDICQNMVEDIVFWCTIYGDSKRFLKEQMDEKYGEKLTEAQKKRILGFKFKDWGNLSKEFLELPGCDKTTGEIRTLIRSMWETNYNLMELINAKEYSYKEKLEEKCNTALKTLSEMKAEDLDEYYFSAPVKRMVWQTLQIIRELEKVLGAAPKRLFIEMTRSDDKQKLRKASRKQKFLELYKSIEKEEKTGRDWKGEIEKADASGRLKSKKMYLYLTQKGRCMYTGESIDIEQLFNDNLYDIDHIYPRHFVKDDNLDNNLVLVKKTVNAHKSDTYPLEESIYRSQKDMWKQLLRQKLITEEKYKRLTGRNPFTDEQKAGFIARQLVETSQGTKGVADILKQVLPDDTKIIYSKASNVSEFRASRKIWKSRSVNEFHHAHDAYLNIVVGNVYYTKFTQNPLNFIQKDYAKDANKNRYNLSRMFDWDIIRDGQVAWIASREGGEAGTIATVKEMLKRNTPLMTRLSFEGHGGIANETLYSAKKASPEKYIPLKESDVKMQDVTRYGGFTSVSTAYFFLVEHELKGKKVRTLETVPIYMSPQIATEPEALLHYCTDALGLVNPDIRVKKIKLQSLLKKDGYFVHISGKTGKQIILRNAVNLCLRPKWIEYIKKLDKFAEFGQIDGVLCQEKNIELYEELLEKHLNGIFAKRPNPVGQKLVKRKDVFEGLELRQQCEVLVQTLKLSSVGAAAYADLSLLEEAAVCGKMLMQKKINGAEELLLINQSVTGLFENRIDLLTI